MSDEEQAGRGGLALEVLSFGLWLVVVLSPLVGIPLGVIFFLSSSFGEQDPSSYSSTTGRLEAPYVIELDDERRIEVPADGPAHYVGFGESESASDQRFDTPSVDLMVRITTNNWWQQAASWALFAVIAGGAWFALFQLWRVVRSARDGDPFSHRNVYRLRWIAVSLAVAPLVLGGASVALDRLVTAEVPATLLAGPGWGVWIVAALGVLAIAEVFRAGADLRDLNQRTV